MFKCCKNDNNTPEHICFRSQPISRGTIAGNLEARKAFFITGQIPPNGDHFAIDFCLDDKDKDIALRLYGCISKKILMRNSRINFAWGQGETDVASNIRLGEEMILNFQVYFEDSSILIALDGKHIASYIHRLPLNIIHCIEVFGDLMSVEVLLKGNCSYPELRPITSRDDNMLELIDLEVQEASGNSRTLSLPYYFTLSEKIFNTGSGLFIRAVVNHVPNSIIIALQNGREVSPQPLKAMHIEIRFNKSQSEEPVIAFNTFIGSKWTGEIKSRRSSGIRAGVVFNLFIGNDGKSFKIFVNKKCIHKYPYLMDLKLVDTCYINGDIRLVEVRNEGI